MAEMPRDIIQITHQSGNVYHFSGQFIRLTKSEGRREIKIRPDPIITERIATDDCYAVGSMDGIFVCKPFESVEFVTPAEKRAAEAKATQRLTRIEKNLLNPKD